MYKQVCSYAGWFDLCQKIMAGEVLDQPLLQVLVSSSMRLISSIALLVDLFVRFTQALSNCQFESQSCQR